MFGNDKITKIMKIEGMSCMHCAKKVEDALKEIKDIKKVDVNLEEKQATVTMKQDVSNEVLKNAIEDLGYTVTDIK